MSKKDKIPKNILVVEDDVSLNNSYVKFLVAEGYIVDSAKNGECQFLMELGFWKKLIS